MAGDVSSAGLACRRYAAGMTRAVRGESCPEGTADHRQGWSEAQPLLNDKREAKPRRGDRQDEPSGVQRDCFLSVAPSGLHRPLRPSRGSASLHPCLWSAAPSGLAVSPPRRTPNTPNVHIQLRWCAAQTRRRRAPNTATAHFRLGCCAEPSQNIIDIFRNSTEISTNSIEIFGNINDILSLEGRINEFDADNGWVRSADAPCFRCVAADFSLRRRRLLAAPRGERRGIVADGRGRRAGRSA